MHPLKNYPNANVGNLRSHGLQRALLFQYAKKIRYTLLASKMSTNVVGINYQF